MSYRVERDWTTQAGFRAVVTMSDMGHRCGYVGLPKGHPLYGAEYSEPSPALTAPSDDEPVGKRGVITMLCATQERMTSPELVFDVHGSLTFSGDGRGQYPVPSDLWWLGYDCGHAGDGASPERLLEMRERYPDSPIMWEDDGEFRSLEYCIDECESLARQIAEKVLAMSTQHTPGPWHAQNGGDVFTALGAATGDGWKAADNDGWHIADCRTGTLTIDDIGDKCELSSGEVLANARLIAAAPDLLAALVALRAYLSKCPPHAEDRTGAEWGRMMDLSGAAIAKAEGKS